MSYTTIIIILYNSYYSIEKEIVTWKQNVFKNSKIIDFAIIKRFNSYNNEIQLTIFGIFLLQTRNTNYNTYFSWLVLRNKNKEF